MLKSLLILLGLQGIVSLANSATLIDEKLIPVLTAKKETFVVSPYSLKTALSLLAPGASGKTEAQLNSLLYGKEKPKTDLLQNIDNDKLKLTSVQKVWVEQSYPLLESYTDTLRTEYNSVIETADFKNKSAEVKIKINEWIEKQTNQKIKDLIPIDALNSMSRLVLVNAIYFLAEWKEPFKKSSTATGSFTKFDGKSVEIKFMNQTYGSLRYYEDADMQAVSIPYKDQETSMVIVLPKKGAQAQTAYRKALVLDFKSFTAERVHLSMPKFKFEYVVEFDQLKEELGIPSLFSDEADFSKMAASALKDKLQVSKIIQKAFIQVDENGTEAAAASAVMMVLGESLPMNQKVFIANRPFLFMIQKNSKNLFMGLFNN